MNGPFRESRGVEAAEQEAEKLRALDARRQRMWDASDAKTRRQLNAMAGCIGVVILLVIAAAGFAAYTAFRIFMLPR